MGEHAPPSRRYILRDDGAPTLVLPLEADERGHALLPDGGGDAYVSYPAVGKPSHLTGGCSTRAAAARA